jgi:hypothetical protein
MNKIQTEVWDTIQKINELWVKENKAEMLIDYFHEQMVVLNPTDHDRILGGKNCVAAWKYFADNSKIIRWKEKDPIIQVFGDGNFAVVTYYFDMAYEMNGVRYDMEGRDMFSMVKENGRWYAVADQFSPVPK